VSIRHATQPRPPAAPVGPHDGAPSTRRSLLRWLWAAFGLAAAGEAAWITVSFLRPREDAGGAEMAIFVAGPADEFAPGTVTAFPAGRFYLARLEDGGFVALDRACTHLGCTVPWVAEEGRFVCPCHASAFDISGAVLNPPAPRPLDLYPVRIENGIVKVDLRRPVRRTEVRPSQMVYA
jgi:cytochrome b6-f complex iron-sulfur subunit